MTRLELIAILAIVAVVLIGIGRLIWEQLRFLWSERRRREDYWAEQRWGPTDWSAPPGEPYPFVRSVRGVVPPAPAFRWPEGRADRSEPVRGHVRASFRRFLEDGTPYRG